MGASLEYKRFSVGFVLAALLVTNTHVALADVLPPPPPPPPPPQTPGTNPTPVPTVPTGSGVLDAPPPPPPGVNIEIAPTVPTTKPPTSTTVRPPAASTIEPMPSVLAPPPKPPPGVDVEVPDPETARVPRRPNTPTSNAGPRSNTLPSHRPQDQPQQTTTGGWYGWKSMIGLVPVHALFIAGIVSDEYIPFIPAFIGGVLVTPIAHWAHGNRGRGWLSFGLNIGTMMAGGTFGGITGVPIVLGIWNVIDVAALHHKTEPVRPPNAVNSIWQSIAIVPMMDHGRKGFTLMGQF